MPENLLIIKTALYSDPDPSRRFDILVENGKISRISPAGKNDIRVKTIDGRGLVAVPGMIDLHIHGAGGSDSLDATEEALAVISGTLARSGTTSFLSTMVVNPHEKNTHVRIAAECTGKDLGGASLLGVYIEGPFINIKKRGGIITDCISAPSESILAKLLEVADGSLKIMCVAPEIPGIETIIKTLKDEGVLTSYGHSDSNYEETINGFNMGISHVTHLYNAMRPLHHRDPGPLAAIFENQRISVELIGDSHHVHPSMIKFARNFKSRDKIICVTDGISGMGLPDGTYTYNNRKYTSKDGLARYLDGTLIGSTMTLGNIVKNYMLFTNCDLREAIETVTINPARILGIDDRKGSLEEGKDADIVLIDDDFTICHTLVEGKPIS